MKIGVLQYAPKINDIRYNLSVIEKMLNKAAYANLWVLPELASSGYAFKTKDEAILASEKVNDSMLVRFLMKEAQNRNSWFVCGINEREGDRLYNSAVLINGEGVIGLYRKLHLFGKEKLFFEKGNLGLPVFDSPWGKIGMLICFDWMFPEIWRLMALKNVQIICHPSNIVLPWCYKALPAYAITNRIFVASANRIGKERECNFTGQSALISPYGEFIFKGKRRKQQALIAEIDPAIAENKQITPDNNLFNDRRPEVYGINIL